MYRSDNLFRKLNIEGFWRYIPLFEFQDRRTIRIPLFPLSSDQQMTLTNQTRFT